MNDSDLPTQIEKAFHDGTVASLPPETWDKFLTYLCAHSPSRVSGVFDPREVNRGILLSTLKNFHFVNQIERSNKRFACLTIFISLIAIVVSLYSMWTSEDQSKNLASIAAAQERQVMSLTSIVTAQEKQIRLLTEMLAESKRLSRPIEAPKSSNSSIERTAKGLRPSSAAHVNR